MSAWLAVPMLIGADLLFGFIVFVGWLILTGNRTLAALIQKSLLGYLGFIQADETAEY